MRQVCNLDGTIMFENTEEVNFTIVRGEVKKVDIVGDFLPIEFRVCKDKAHALLLYLDEVVVPETRIGLQSELAKHDIPYFDMDTILQHFNGYSIHSHHWLRFSEGPQTWDELKDRLLSSEGGECLRKHLECKYF